MPTAPDPFQPHLTRAAALFEQGDVMQAGQIWQAILKRDPAHRAARAGLYQVKLVLEQRNGQADHERLLQEGCTLFDMGQVQDALQKWERILAGNPRHKLALAYANDARRELGLPTQGGPSEDEAAAPEAPSRPAPETPGRTESAAQLVLEGVQLYDMGMTEEAMGKWERALKLDPEHKDAPSYLAMARRDLEEAARPKSAPPARPAAPPRPEPEAGSSRLEAQIGHAELLLRQQRLEEAAQAFQALLDQEPQDLRVLRGYHQARALLAARNETPVIALSVVEPPPSPSPAPVGPPPALITQRSAPPRGGLHIPRSLKGLVRLKGRGLPRWLDTPRNLALAIGLVVVLLAGLIVFGAVRREAALKEAVAAAKQSALRPVSRMVEIPSLTETTEAIHQEADLALDGNPLLAYFRAQEWQQREPDNPAAADLMTRVKAKLAGVKPSGTLADYDQDLAGGDLDGARRCVLGLLAAAPDDPDLRARAAKVVLALVPRYATENKLDDARDALTLGRAMFPQERIWQARLKLLEAIQAMPKADRAPWIQLLG